MSETLVLTKKQQKSSLSAKKTKTRETIRNVLATPYSKYWPLVSNQDAQHLQDVLSKYLPRVLPENVKIPWKDLKAVPISERRSFRKEYVKQKSAMFDENSIGEKHGLIFGVNDTTKAMEKGIIKSVLIVQDVQPKLMVEHLIDQSVLGQFPVLVVPELRSFLKNTCGLSSMAIAFTDTAKYEIVQHSIEEVHRKYPVPRNHINFQRSLDNVNSSVIVIEDSIIEPSLSQDDSKMGDDSIVSSIVDSSLDRTNTTVKDSEIESDDGIYLYRTALDKRVFIPGKSIAELRNNSQMQVDATGFLSFSIDSSPSPIKQKKHYTSLKVMRVKGDTNRNKRKIEDTKRRSSNKIKKTR